MNPLCQNQHLCSNPDTLSRRCCPGKRGCGRIVFPSKMPVAVRLGIHSPSSRGNLGVTERMSLSGEPRPGRGNTRRFNPASTRLPQISARPWALPAAFLFLDDVCSPINRISCRPQLEAGPLGQAGQRDSRTPPMHKITLPAQMSPS